MPIKQELPVPCPLNFAGPTILMTLLGKPVCMPSCTMRQSSVAYLIANQQLPWNVYHALGTQHAILHMSPRQPNAGRRSDLELPQTIVDHTRTRRDKRRLDHMLF